MTQPGDCNLCEIGANCDGKDLIYPQPNYWRPES